MDTDPDAAMDTGLYAGHSATSRSEHAYRSLKRPLLLGEFPFGQRLGEERLAALMGVSRTPIREALARLHAEGHVSRHPEGGYEPAFPDMGRIAELYEVRTALESMAVGRGVGGSPGSRHDRQALSELRADWLALTDDPASHADTDFVLVDEDFHVRLAMASGNAAAAEMLVTVNERIRVVRVHDFLTGERVVATVEEHLGILDALLDHDAERARIRLGAHIAESARVASDRAVAAMVRMMAARG